MKSEDRLAFMATASPNTTINIAANGPHYEGCDRVRAHCARFDIGHLMCTAHVYLQAGLFWESRAGW